MSSFTGRLIKHLAGVADDQFTRHVARFPTSAEQTMDLEDLFIAGVCISHDFLGVVRKAILSMAVSISSYGSYAANR